MNELYKEIEDDIRRERFDRIWHSFGKAMVGLSVAVIIATVIIVAWQNYRQSYHSAQTTQFIKGTDRLAIEDYKGAIAAFAALADDPNSSYYGLAMLQKARAERLSGDEDASAATYKTLASQGTVFGDLAKLQESDGVIEPKRGSAFYHSQQEWRGWQLAAAGKKDEAVKIFLALRDDDAGPYSMRQRLHEALLYLAPDKAVAGEPSKQEKPHE